jgi:hypothetical protein
MRANHIPKPEMNKTEERYAWILEAQKRSGEIKWYGFEKIKLKISSLKCWYNVDFMVIDKDDVVKMIEVKGGRIWEDSIVKFKAACELYPFIKFVMVQYKNKQWKTIREN